jgi:tight adherence protein C
MYEAIAGPLAPLIFAMLAMAATWAIWVALAPARPKRAVVERLHGYVDRTVAPQPANRESSLRQRVATPIFQRLLRFLGGFMPARDLDKVAQQLSLAGNPGNLTALDFVGLRLIVAALVVGGYYLYAGRQDDIFTLVRNCFFALAAGFMLPKFWLGQKIKQRRNAIARALPDALDMLTIGVEAGLAFESALLRVGDQWDNELAQEFRRLVAEIRIGVPRNEALRHMADRCGVEDLRTFVAVLIQSNMLGVSIAQVLHTQADQMRLRRRQYAEEQAHAATVKIVLVLVAFIFPALFVVILGPTLPRIFSMMSSL